MLSRAKNPVLYPILFWLLVALLVVQGALLLVSAAMDTALYAKEQMASILLRLLFVAFSVGALVHVLHDWFRPTDGRAVRVAAARRRPPGLGESRRPAVEPPPDTTAGPERYPWQYPLVLLSQAAALPMFFIPVWIELRSPHHHPADWAWMALSALLLLGAAVILVSALIRGHVNVGWVAVGALMPLLGFAQFAYLTFYKPTHERPKVDVTTALVKEGDAKGVTRMRGTVTLKNNGEAPAEVFGAMYTVSRHRMRSVDGMTADQGRDVFDGEKPNRRHFGRFVSLLGFDELLTADESLAPGETRAHSFVLDVPGGGTDLVRLTSYVSLSTPRGEATTRPCDDETGPDVCVKTEIKPTSWARESMGDNPKARTKVHFGSGDTKLMTEPPYLTTTYEYDGKGEQDDAQAIDPLVRDQFTQSITELRLDP
ncbi:hypothetical protein ACFWPV_34075 [Streptomyces uncialis]|uniref:hypothetical protein n=1 Tax=Streptomyces uncialis TaxID=1048205 RepID=UPI003648AC13